MARPKLIQVSLSQMETVLMSEFQNVAELMMTEFDMDPNAVRSFIRSQMEGHITAGAKTHFDRYAQSQADGRRAKKEAALAEKQKHAQNQEGVRHE